jgi:hypothetical protein
MGIALRTIGVSFTPRYGHHDRAQFMVEGEAGSHGTPEIAVDGFRDHLDGGAHHVGIRVLPGPVEDPMPDDQGPGHRTTGA